MNMDAPVVNPDTLAALNQRRADLVTALTNINATLTMVAANAGSMSDEQYTKRRADLISQKADVEQELATLKEQIRACNILKSAADKRAADERKAAGAKTNLDNLQRAVRKGHARPSELEQARTAVADSGVLVPLREGNAPASGTYLVTETVVRDMLIAYCMGSGGAIDPSAPPMSTPELAKYVIDRARQHDYLISHVRPEVRAFAYAMEERLRKNDWKGGWKTMTARTLLTRIGQEVKELKVELNRKGGTPARVTAEAVDVANFAMMVADICNGLNLRTTDAPDKSA